MVQISIEALLFQNFVFRLQLIAGFYSEGSLVIWNGNNVVGAENITRLYQSFPGSEHIVHCLDCQPVATGDVQSQKTVLVACQGEVKYDDTNSIRPFTQNFMLVKQGEVWKVASDCFRFLD